MTIEAREREELKVKGSRFIASVAPVTTKDEAMAFVDDIRREFYDASHNCFAYRLGPLGMNFRAADDGEPSGSAGKPMLFSIQKYKFCDIAVVVTRYFGGVKLGVGGLARAYSSAAEMALELCTPKTVHVTIPVRVYCSYEDINIIKRLMNEYAVSFEEVYTDTVQYVVHVHASKAEEFADKVSVTTQTRAAVKVLEEA